MIFKIRNEVIVNTHGEITVSFSEVWIDCKGWNDEFYRSPL